MELVRRGLHGLLNISLVGLLVFHGLWPGTYP